MFKYCFFVQVDDMDLLPRPKKVKRAQKQASTLSPAMPAVEDGAEDAGDIIEDFVLSDEEEDADMLAFDDDVVAPAKELSRETKTYESSKRHSTGRKQEGAHSDSQGKRRGGTDSAHKRQRSKPGAANGKGMAKRRKQH